jgi:TonB family protein
MSKTNAKDSGKHEKREVEIDTSHEQMTQAKTNISHCPVPRPNFPAEPRAQDVTRPRPLPLTRGVRSIALTPKSMTVPRSNLNQDPLPLIPPKLASGKPATQVPIPLPNEFEAPHRSLPAKPQPVLNPHPVSSAMLGPTAVPIITRDPRSEETSAQPSPLKRLGQTGNTSANLPVPTRAQYSRDSEKGSLLPLVRSTPRLDSSNYSNPPPNEHAAGPAEITTGEDPNWPVYMADLQRRIKRAWFPPRRQENRKVVIIFKIHRNGELHDLHLSKSSGFALADQQAIAAIENAAPFRELPQGAQDDVDIQFEFDYNVFNGSERGLIRGF